MVFSRRHSGVFVGESLTDLVDLIPRLNHPEIHERLNAVGAILVTEAVQKHLKTCSRNASRWVQGRWNRPPSTNAQEIRDPQPDTLANAVQLNFIAGRARQSGFSVLRFAESKERDTLQPALFRYLRQSCFNEAKTYALRNWGKSPVVEIQIALRTLEEARLVLRSASEELTHGNTPAWLPQRRDLPTEPRDLKRIIDCLTSDFDDACIPDPVSPKTVRALVRLATEEALHQRRLVREQGAGIA